ncbi:MAG: phospholipase, partial [Rhodothermales bacterium]|nr:phospholipase [Rhodothermales bacterium]
MESNRNDPHAGFAVAMHGRSLDNADAAVILVHGRGATAESILELSSHLHQPNFAYLSPQAADNTWYPYSFLAPLEKNEPYLSSGLNTIDRLVREVVDSGIPAERIVLAGFSQGGCLASEYVARNA